MFSDKRKKILTPCMVSSLLGQMIVNFVFIGLCTKWWLSGTEVFGGSSLLLYAPSRVMASPLQLQMMENYRCTSEGQIG